MTTQTEGSRFVFWIAGAALVAAGLISAFIMRPTGEVAEMAAVAPAVVEEPIAEAPSVAEEESAVAETVQPVEEAPEPVAPESEEIVDVDAAEPSEDATAEVVAPAPQFDVVRVDPSGSAVIAGQGTPGETVQILLDGAVIGEAQIDASGQFAALQTLEPSDTPQSLQLSIGDGDAQRLSDDEILLAPRAAAQTDDVEQEVAEAPTTVLRIDDEGVDVVQPAQEADLPPEVVDAVALDTITYAPSGEVALGGRAREGFVRIYLDDTPILTAPVDEDGQWRTELPEVDTGVYQLRVDELDADGQVISRVETPFRREDRTTVAAEAVPVDGEGISISTVQPGSTLWAIARERYGDGTLYVRVFDANRDRIRDPDLIYPGQVFTLPEG